METQEPNQYRDANRLNEYLDGIEQINNAILNDTRLIKWVLHPTTKLFFAYLKNLVIEAKLSASELSRSYIESEFLKEYYRNQGAIECVERDILEKFEDIWRKNEA